MYVQKCLDITSDVSEHLFLFLRYGQAKRRVIEMLRYAYIKDMLPQTQEPDNNRRPTSRSNYKAREESYKEYIIIWYININVHEHTTNSFAVPNCTTWKYKPHPHHHTLAHTHICVPFSFSVWKFKNSISCQKMCRYVTLQPSFERVRESCTALARAILFFSFPHICHPHNPWHSGYMLYTVLGGSVIYGWSRCGGEKVKYFERACKFVSVL